MSRSKLPRCESGAVSTRAPVSCVAVAVAVAVAVGAGLPGPEATADVQQVLFPTPFGPGIEVPYTEDDEPHACGRVLNSYGWQFDGWSAMQTAPSALGRFQPTYSGDRERVVPLFETDDWAFHVRFHHTGPYAPRIVLIGKHVIDGEREDVIFALRSGTDASGFELAVGSADGELETVVSGLVLADWTDIDVHYRAAARELDFCWGGVKVATASTGHGRYDINFIQLEDMGAGQNYFRNIRIGHVLAPASEEGEPVDVLARLLERLRHSPEAPREELQHLLDAILDRAGGEQASGRGAHDLADHAARALRRLMLAHVQRRAFADALQATLVDLHLRRRQPASALWEARSLVEACHPASFAIAAQRLAAAVEAVDGHRARLDAYLRFRVLGRAGGDGAPGTDDDLADPFADLSAPVARYRSVQDIEALAAPSNDPSGTLQRTRLLRRMGRLRPARARLRVALRRGPIDQATLYDVFDELAEVSCLVSGDPGAGVALAGQRHEGPLARLDAAAVAALVARAREHRLQRRACIETYQFDRLDADVRGLIEAGRIDDACQRCFDATGRFQDPEVGRRAVHLLLYACEQRDVTASAEDAVQHFLVHFDDAHPHHRYARLHAGLRLYQRRAYDRALAHLTAYTRQFPGSPWHDDALLATAGCLFRRGAYDAAGARARDIVARDLEGRLAPQAQLLIGLTGLATNDPEGAARDFQLVIDRYPDTPAADKARGHLERLGALEQ